MRTRFAIGGLLAWVLLTCCLVASCDRGLNAASAQTFVEQWRLRYDSHDLGGFTALYASEGAYTVPPQPNVVRTREELRDTLEKSWRRWPDLRITSLTDVVAAGDRIAFVFSLTDGTRATWGATFLRLEDGRITWQLTISR